MQLSSPKMRGRSLLVLIEALQVAERLSQHSTAWPKTALGTALAFLIPSLIPRSCNLLQACSISRGAKDWIQWHNYIQLAVKWEMLRGELTIPRQRMCWSTVRGGTCGAIQFLRRLLRSSCLCLAALCLLWGGKERRRFFNVRATNFCTNPWLVATVWQEHICFSEMIHFGVRTT